MCYSEFNEMIEHIARLDADVLSVEQLWVNPDCGLKTRGWEETLPALRNLVEAARRRRVAVGEPVAS
jgi:5-methyltetrahydropteroyltriglutamate--homocysteine methyltransferase